MLLEVTTGGYMLPLVIRYYHWLLLLPLVAYHYCNFCCHWFVVLSGSLCSLGVGAIVPNGVPGILGAQHSSHRPGSQLLLMKASWHRAACLEWRSAWSLGRVPPVANENTGRQVFHSVS